jgi:hypothetical protein
MTAQLRASDSNEQSLGANMMNQNSENGAQQI